MSLALHELLQRHIKKMVSGIGSNEKGNIYPLIMQEVERCVIGSVLTETRNNYFRAAKILGISRSTLYRKIGDLKIEDQGRVG